MKQTTILRTPVLITALLLCFAVSAHAKNYFDAGWRHYVHKNWEKAKENFLKDIEINDRGDSYYFIGEIEKNRGDLHSALEYFEKAIVRRMTPKYRTLTYWNLIIIYESKSDFAKMVKTCKLFYENHREAAAKTKAENLINKLMWTENPEANKIYQEGIALKSSNYPAAIQLFRQAHSIDRAFYAPLFELGMYYYSQGMYSDALSFFIQILDRIPFYGELQMLVGEIYFHQKRFHDAVSAYEAALEYAFLDNEMEYSIKLKLATSYFNIDEHTKAEEISHKAIQINSRNITPYLLLSAISMKKNNFDEALDPLHKAHKIDPRNPEVLYQLGLVYHRKDDLRAYEYFEKVYLQYRQRQREIPAKYIKAVIQTALYYFSAKKYSKVVELTAQVPANLRDESLMLNYARSLYMLAQYSEAIVHFNKFRLSNDDLHLLCRCYALINDTAKVKEIISSNFNNTAFIQKVTGDRLLSNFYKEVEMQRRSLLQQEQLDQTKDSSQGHETSTEPAVPNQ